MNIGEREFCVGIIKSKFPNGLKPQANRGLGGDPSAGNAQSSWIAGTPPKRLRSIGRTRDPLFGARKPPIREPSRTLVDQSYACAKLPHHSHLIFRPIG